MELLEPAKLQEIVLSTQTEVAILRKIVETKLTHNDSVVVGDKKTKLSVPDEPIIIGEDSYNALVSVIRHNGERIILAEAIDDTELMQTLITLYPSSFKKNS